MIVFDLRCDSNHLFEGWFQSGRSFEAQSVAGQVECPFCGSTTVSKSLMAPHIPAKGERERHISDFVAADHVVAASANLPESMEASAQDVKRALEHMHQTMKKFRARVETECDYVGDKFADEARAMHEGAIATRGIYGEATLEETEDLLNDGIDILPVPGLDKLDS